MTDPLKSRELQGLTGWLLYIPLDSALHFSALGFIAINVFSAFYEFYS
jgi:hypothetical protein